MLAAAVEEPIPSTSNASLALELLPNSAGTAQGGLIGLVSEADSDGDLCSLESVTLWLHRGQVLHELEDFFMNHRFWVKSQPLVVKMVNPNGRVENAEDSGGILRDALSEYWSIIPWLFFLFKIDKTQRTYK